MSRLITNGRSEEAARRTRGRVRLLAAAAACLALLVAATPAWASTNTVAIGSVASVTAKIAVAVPVTVVCDPLTDPGIASTVAVSVQQASGKQISTASGSVFAGPGLAGTMLICDGTTENHVVVQALPDEGSGPFKGGPAFVTARFTYQSGFSCGNGCYFTTGSETGSGSAAIKLR